MVVFYVIFAKTDSQEMFSTRKMWVWKNRTKSGIMVLLGMLKRKSSISDPGHKNSTNYLKYQRKQKTKIFKVYSGATYATRKSIMHKMTSNAPTANI